MNFNFSFMKKLWDAWHFGYIHGCHSYPRNDHLCSKSAQKRQLLLGTVYQWVKSAPIFFISITLNYFCVVNNWKVLTFSVVFLCQKLFESFSFFFIEKHRFRSTESCKRFGQAVQTFLTNESKTFSKTEKLFF